MRSALNTIPEHVAGEYEALLANASDTFEFEDFDEIPSTTFYTSGTTGDPKGVFFTHRQLVLHTITEIIAVRRLMPMARVCAIAMCICR